MKTIYIKGQPVQVKDVIGEGQEAVVYRLSPHYVAKIYRQGNDPFYQGNIHEQQSAKKRLDVAQKKLLAFPQKVSHYVVGPQELIYNKQQEIIGYVMPFIDKAHTLLLYGDKAFRQQSGITNNTIMTIFQNMHRTLTDIHHHGIVIGDFNDMNILVREGKAYFIDTDSWQYKSYLCSMYTDKYVDPRLCTKVSSRGVDMMTLAQPHTQLSDWYAFQVLLWKSLLLVEPYGGVYKPSAQGKKVKQNLRALERISVLHPDVIYPKHAYPPSVLPKDLFAWMNNTFTHDMRKPFPYDLLTQAQWHTCPQCGVEHATAQCPVCNTDIFVPAATHIVTGNVRATTILRTRDSIVYANIQSSGLHYIIHKNNGFYRENGEAIVENKPLSPLISYRVDENKSFILEGETSTRYMQYQKPYVQYVDEVGAKSCFDTSENTTWYIQNGEIIKEKETLTGTQKVSLAQGVAKQTVLWTHKDSGFALYKAGSCILTGIVIPTGSNRGIETPLPLPQGTIIDIQSVLSDTRIWVFFRMKQQNTYRNSCIILDYNGTILGTHETDAEDGSWLGSIYGHTASHTALFAPTDKGIVRVTYANGQWEEKLFASTEPYVHSKCQLLGSPHGIYVITGKTIVLLTIT